MSVVSSDLVLYQAATQSDADGVPVGGAVDPLRRPDFTQLGGNDTVQAVSSNNGDTMTVTVEARDVEGRVVSETKALTGTTPITFSTLGTVSRILKVETASGPAGSVTVRRTTGPTTIRIIPAGERGFSMFLRKDPSATASPTSYYAKVFWKNTNGTLATLFFTVQQTADPSGLMTFGLAASVDDSGTAATRKTAPAGVVFDASDKACPGTDLGSGSAIGTWLKLALIAGNAPLNTTYTSGWTGQSI